MNSCLVVSPITLYAVREHDDSNYKTEWRFRTQFLGSVLLWAVRAGAAIEYKPKAGDPFVYTDANGNSVDSEFPQPPDELRDGMIESLFIDTIDGHPIKRPVRRFVSRWFGKEAHGLIVPDSDNAIESEWSIVVDEQLANFQIAWDITLHTVLEDQINLRSNRLISSEDQSRWDDHVCCFVPLSPKDSMTRHYSCGI